MLGSPDREAIGQSTDCRLTFSFSSLDCWKFLLVLFPFVLLLDKVNDLSPFQKKKILIHRGFLVLLLVLEPFTLVQKEH